MPNISVEDLGKHRMHLLFSIFGLENDVFGQWPGAYVYMRYIERELRSMQYVLFDPVLHELYPGHAGGYKGSVTFMCDLAKQLKNNMTRHMSIEEVLQDLLRSREVTSVPLPELYHAIFAIIGWTTMLVRPIIDPFDREASLSNFRIIKPSRNGGMALQPLDLVKRPITTVLKAFGKVIPEFDGKVIGNPRMESEALYVSTLNYHSLQTFGKINIRWVDVLSAHLEFDPLTRTLMLFRFPTFCALNCIQEEKWKCFDR